MMINKRLIGTVGESKKYIAWNVAAQWCCLAANIAMMTAVTGLLASLYTKTAGKSSVLAIALVAVIAVMIRLVCTVFSSRMGYLSSKSVKKTLREKIYRKLLRLGAAYNEQVKTWAKKLLSKYWGQYTALGDTFLENLQGLTTLKIYRADGLKNEEGHDMGA